MNVRGQLKFRYFSTFGKLMTLFKIIQNNCDKIKVAKLDCLTGTIFKIILQFGSENLNK